MQLGKLGILFGVVWIAAAAGGCRSPYYADQGALLGGLGGAGVGALVGNAVGNTAAGAVIGAGVGAIGGAAVGSSLDEIEARNRAEIEARLGRPVSAGQVTIEDVIAMTQAGVEPDLIINHVRANGVTAPPSTQDLILLRQEGVSPRVVKAMQAPPARPVVVRESPPVIIEEHYYDPFWGHHYHSRPSHWCRPRHDSHVSWGVSFGH